MTDNRLPITLKLDDTAPPSHRDLADVVLSLDDQRQALRHGGHVNVLASGAIALEQIIRALRQLAADTKRDTAELMAEQDEQRLIIGDRIIEPAKTRPGWRWDSDELLRLVTAKALGERWPDEVPPEAMEAAGVILDAFRDVLSLGPSTPWRTGTATSPGLRDWLDRETIAEHRSLSGDPQPTIRIR